MRVVYAFLVVIFLGGGLYGFLTWVDRTNASPEIALATANICLGATLVLATLLLVDEGRRMREASFAPGVSVTIGPLAQVAGVHEIRIQNFGKGPAHDISFVLSGDLLILGGTKLSHMPVLKHGVKYLEPGGEYRTVVGGPEFYSDNSGGSKDPIPPFKVVTKFRSQSGKGYVDTSWIELREYTLATPVDKEISNSLKVAAESLRKIASRK